MKINKTIFHLLFIGLLSSYCHSQTVIIDSLPYKERFKTIRLYNPNSSSNETLNDVPILFMLDGQNLFDDSTSFSGEWHVDESVSSLNYVLKPLVIGIDHGNAARMEELTPFPNEKYGGGDADYFLNWILNDLLNFLEVKYSLELQVKKYAIAGSSLGGLFSHYAILKRPDKFKYAGVFSPSYWFNSKIYDITMNSETIEPRFIFIAGGTKESETHVPNLTKMVDILKDKSNLVVKLTINENGEHNEKQWSDTFPIFLEWWLQLNK